MTRKLLITFAFILCSIFLINYSFAADEMNKAGNAVQNVMENTKNGVENVARDTAGAIKEGTNKIENAGQNMTNDMMNNRNSGTDSDTSAIHGNNRISDNSNYNDNNNSGYTATRTSTGMFGMNNTVWTWVILGIIAAAIIGLVWYYAVQNTNSHQE